MEIKSYLDDLEAVKSPAESRNVKVLADGRRIQENIRTVKLDDGTKQYTHEILEEVVPMRVAKRVQRRVAQVPVEERIECIAEDGTVTTEVRTLDSALLDLDREPTTLEQLARDVRGLKEVADGVQPQSKSLTGVTPDVKPKTAARKKGQSFWTRASARYGKGRIVAAGEDVEAPDNTNALDVEEEEVVEVKQGKMAEFGLTTVAWAVFAVVAGLVTYLLL